jgi:hypothetical protein
MVQRRRRRKRRRKRGGPEEKALRLCCWRLLIGERLGRWSAFLLLLCIFFLLLCSPLFLFFSVFILPFLTLQGLLSMTGRTVAPVIGGTASNGEERERPEREVTILLFSSVICFFRPLYSVLLLLSLLLLLQSLTMVELLSLAVLLVTKQNDGGAASNGGGRETRER